MTDMKLTRIYSPSLVGCQLQLIGEWMIFPPLFTWISAHFPSEKASTHYDSCLLALFLHSLMAHFRVCLATWQNWICLKIKVTTRKCTSGFSPNLTKVHLSAWFLGLLQLGVSAPHKMTFFCYIFAYKTDKNLTNHRQK